MAKFRRDTRDRQKRVGNKGKPGLSKNEREREGGKEKKRGKKSSKEGINLALGK